MKIKTIILMLLIFPLGIFAQQDISVSQYMFNGLHLNPAYAGSNDYMSASITARNQWTKFDGAPKTGVFGIDGKLRNETMGLGLTFCSDKIGATSTNEVFAIYSFHVRTGTNSHLSFGLKAGVSNFQERMDELVYWDYDKVFSENTSLFFPKFGFGAYYYTDKFYAGVSAPTLLVYDTENYFDIDLEKSTFFRRHYYFTTGYVFDVSDNVKLKPFSLVKYVPAAPLQFDVNMSAVFNDRYWIGGGYRFNNSVTALVMLQLNENVRFGYSYDFMRAELSRYAGLTHEVHIGWDFGGNLKKVKSVRYF